MAAGDRSGTPGSRRSAAETWRQLLHIVSGTWALLLRWMEPWPLILLALAAVIFNARWLPRVGGRRLWRGRELAAGQAPGMVLYPLSVLLLLTLFYRRPEIAAVGWGLLAFADGAATLAGRTQGAAPLPWNPAKTWRGSLTYLAVGWASAFGMLVWVGEGARRPLFTLAVAAVTALAAALLESAPQRLDDNLRVPVPAAVLLLCLLETSGLAGRLPQGELVWMVGIGLAINVVLAAAAHRLGTLDGGGAVAAAVVGTVVFAFLSWPGYGLLLVFFLLGSSTTRIGYAAKQRRSLAEHRGGRRGVANVLANGGVAAGCAVFAGLTPHQTLFSVAFAASLAAAAADTVESEIGQLWGRPTRLITTFQPVAAGTDGGISLVGTLAGLLAASFTAVAGWLLGLYAAAAVLPIGLLALAATLLESLVGATWERRGLLDNHGVNSVNTLLAALLAAAWVTFVG